MKKRRAPNKKCPECEAVCHVRSAICKKCDHVFYLKKKKNQIITDWQNLKKGDLIKSVGGNGPYWENPETKDKLYMGHYGKYVVQSVMKEGIMAIENKRHSHCYEFIYMGKSKRSNLMDNYYNRPHKIVYC